jgi:hypothetical protein
MSQAMGSGFDTGIFMAHWFVGLKPKTGKQQEHTEKP